ncbi:hypothetical protein [Anabaenopsis arnoldii]|nr:hypothetical protein [Anabaenopsis arnoldii]MDH6092989.1 hypothetical protein [Anabaenopsis arnoldii]
MEKYQNTCGKPVELVRKIFGNDKNYKILVIGNSHLSPAALTNA